MFATKESIKSCHDNICTLNLNNNSIKTESQQNPEIADKTASEKACKRVGEIALEFYLATTFFLLNQSS